jgi:hypothetical protein
MPVQPLLLASFVTISLIVSLLHKKGLVPAPPPAVLPTQPSVPGKCSSAAVIKVVMIKVTMIKVAMIKVTMTKVMSN